MGWQDSLIRVGIAAVFFVVAVLILAAKKPRNRRIRITAAELDPASVTGQFYVPYGQRDKK